jgi:hypothetical protein
MSNELPMWQDEFKPTVNCLRCGRVCRPGTPDPKGRAIRQASAGFCPNCMITKFLLSIEPIRDLIEGTPARGDLVKARPGRGPEILFGPEGVAAKKQIAVVLTHTQMRESEIDWIEVVGNWGLPWPKGREPKPGNF